LFDSIDEDTDMPQKALLQPVAGSMTPVLSCVDLSVTIGDSTLLAPLSIDAGAGEWIVLLGPNGAGKSSALRALSGVIVDKRDGIGVSGTVRVQNKLVSTLSPREVGQHIAMVPQMPVYPIGVSVFDYVLLGRTPHLGWLGRPGASDRAIVRDLLLRLDLASFSDRAVTSLSGGERQRAVIARSLAQKAPILVLDEPTSALDVGHQQQVLELVDELREQDGLVIVSSMHDLTLAGQYAHHLVLLVDGVSVMSGAPKDVLVADVLETTYGARLRSVHLADGGVAVFPVRADDTIPTVTPVDLRSA
jgi:iron complex transport system ATP-binding protein